MSRAVVSVKPAQLGLKGRILLLVGSVTAVLLLTVFTVFTIKGKELIIAHLERSSISVTRAFSVFVLDSLVKDANGLQQAEDVLGHYILDFLEKNPKILAIAVYGPEDSIVAGGGIDGAENLVPDGLLGDRAGGPRSAIHRSEDRGWISSVVFPLATGEKYWGSLAVHFSADAEHREVTRLFWSTTALAGLLILGVLVIMYPFLSRLTRSLGRLREEMDDFDVSSEEVVLPGGSQDEISMVLTHFNELKRRLGASRQELLDAQKQVYHAEKLASIGRFASGIAHEINNPLNGIENCLYAIEKEPENLAQTRQYLKLATEGLKHIGMVVRKLLSFSRGQSQERSAVHLQAEVETVLGLLAFKLERSLIDIATNFDERLPAIQGDPHLIQELVMNLVLNSVDAVGERRDKEGETFAGEIILATRREGDEVFLTVSDNGGGIPSAVVDQIFDPFFTTKEQGKGTGLGLSVALGIAQSHGGSLDVESESNQSSEFTARFPIGDLDENSLG